AGLNTLQFQSVTVNPNNASDIMGGTQDNGTWITQGSSTSWMETVGGDGGQTMMDAGNPLIRMHSYTGAQHDVSFNGGSPLSWDWISDGLNASGEGRSFYVPLKADQVTGGTVFVGQRHIWRTTDDGGPKAYLDLHCNEFSGDFAVPCGDWVRLGGTTLNGNGD